MGAVKNLIMDLENYYAIYKETYPKYERWEAVRLCLNEKATYDLGSVGCKCLQMVYTWLVNDTIEERYQEYVGQYND